MTTKPVVRQSGVIPYRIVDGEIEIMLITNSSRSAWLVPKGHVEPHLSAPASALKEAYEEAGVIGMVDPRPIGSFEYVKRAAVRIVHVYPMSVASVLPTWPEMDRRRRWVPAEQAVDLVGYARLDRCIEALILELRRAMHRGEAAA